MHISDACRNEDVISTYIIVRLLSVTSNLQVSPGKGNIWGSPVQNSPLPAKEEGIQNLLQMLKGPSANGDHGEIRVLYIFFFMIV